MFTKEECQILLNIVRKAATDNEEEMQLILDVRKKLVEEIKNGD